MRYVDGIVGADIVLRGLDPGSISRLRRALRYSNPEYVKANMIGSDSDADIPRHLYALEERQDGSVIAPRGAVFEVKSTLLARGIKVRWTDHRANGAKVDYRLRDLTLRDYQIEGVRRLSAHLQGMIVLPCAGGKTLLGVGAIADVGRAALVVVPTRDLVDQWAEDVRKHLGIVPSVFGKGKHQLGTVTIATKEALLYHEPPALDHYGFAVFDECHKAPSRTHQKLLSMLPARYRLGLTATPKRADGTTKLIRFAFGELLLEKTVAELVEGGWLVLPSVQAVFTNFSYDFPEDPSWYHFNKLTDAIMDDERRNKLITSLVTDAPEETWMLLSPSRKAHCHTLANMLTKAGVKALAVTGDMAAGKRKNAMQALRDGTLTAMCATSLADMGLNIKRLSRIVLALPESSRANTAQRIGRSMRPLGAKKPIVYDVVDAEVPKLFKRWSTRKSEYRKLGLEVQSCPTLSLFGTATG